MCIRDRVRPLLAMAEALLCYQANPRNFNRDGPSHLKSKMPVPREVVETLCMETSAIFHATPGDHSTHPPIIAVESVITVTRHILGKEWERPFNTWLKATIARFNRIAGDPRKEFLGYSDFPSARDFKQYVTTRVGPPFPPEACNKPDLAPEMCIRDRIPSSRRCS